MSVEGVLHNSNLDGSDYQVLTVTPGKTINQWLDGSGFRKQLDQMPTVIEVNGEQVCERDYDRVLCNGDHLVLKVLSQGPLMMIPAIIWQMAAVIVVAALVLPGMMEPTLPASADQKEGSPLYSNGVKGNRHRPDSKGSILYGTTRIIPDFSRLPYSVYDAEGQQHYYMRFRICRGLADTDLESGEFEDTPLSNFSDYKIEKVPPGEKSLLVPADVIPNGEVTDIEIQDSVSSAYVVCGVGKRVNRVEFDVHAPQLYKQDRETGSLLLYTVRVDFDVQEIDDSGVALGGWNVVGQGVLSNDNQTAVRRSFGIDLPEGRYQARTRRATAKDDSTYVQDTVRWIGLKGYEQDDAVSDCTEVALVLRSSDQVGNRALTNFSIVASRFLPIWSAEHGWSEPVRTNHFAWALADLCRADYAGQRPDTHYKLSQLVEFAERSDLVSAEFNAYFDTEGISVWDALERAGLPGRVKVIDYAGQYWFIRDEQQPLSVQKFTMRNIVAGSYRKKSPNFVTENADSVVVKFRDKTANWELYNDGDGLLCKVPESPGLKPRPVDLFGIDDPVEAKKIGMYLASQSAYRRDLPQWQTGNEGRIPFFGSQVSLSHFLLGREGREQISGDILEKDVVASELQLSEPVPSGLTDPHIVFRDNRGVPSAAFKVQVVGVDGFRVKVLPIDDGGAGIDPDWTQVRTGVSGEEDTHFSLGDGPTFLDLIKITRASKSGEKVTLQGYVDDPRVYLLSEDVTPPDSYSPAGKPSLAPVVRNLEVNLTGTLAGPIIHLSYEGVNCDYFEIFISEDGINFSQYGSKTISSTARIAVDPGHYYFKVYGFNILRGAPATIDVLTADVANAVPAAPSNIQLREVFTGPTLKLQWDGVTVRHLVSVLVGGVEQYFEALDAGDEWDYPAELAQEFGVGRSFTVRVFSIGENTIVSTDYAEISVSNPAPAILNNLSVTPVGEFAQIRFDLPADTDFKGVSVWVGDNQGFSIGVGARVITRSFDPVLSVPIGRNAEKRLVIAAEDEWGSSGLNYSGEYAVAGTLITETDIGPNAVKSPHVAANQITAVHTFIQQLSAISADMGEIVAGLLKTSASGSAVRVEMDSAGSLPFWIGELVKNSANGHAFYDKDTKTFTFQDPVTGIRLEIQPGGAMPIWIGSGTKTPENSFLNINAATGVLSLRGLQILDDAGGVVLASGTGFDFEVEWNQVNGRPTSLAALNAGEGSKLANIADNADATNYDDYRVSNHVTDSGITTIAAPGGARANLSGTQTGAIVIKLPRSWSNSMLNMEIDVYLYSDAGSFTAKVGGYTYTNGSWINEFAQIMGHIGGDNRVRFGHDGTVCCIVIGDTTSSWSYPKISVRNFMAGHSGTGINAWRDGWDVVIDSALTGFVFTGDFADALLDAKSIQGQGALATQDGVDYDAVGGVKPPSDADKTSDNTAAGFDGQGALSLLDSVSETYIANLSVSSLKIQGSAVTIVASYYSSAKTEISYKNSGGYGSWGPIAYRSIPITDWTSTSVVLIDAAFASMSWGNYDSSEDGEYWFQARLLRNGSVIRSWGPDELSGKKPSGRSKARGWYGEQGRYLLQYEDKPGNGSWNYVLEGRFYSSGDGGHLWAADKTMRVVGAKR